jgi:hypothetical protein
MTIFKWYLQYREIPYEPLNKRFLLSPETQIHETQRCKPKLITLKIIIETFIFVQYFYNVIILIYVLQLVILRIPRNNR